MTEFIEASIVLIVVSVLAILFEAWWVMLMLGNVSIASNHALPLLGYQAAFWLVLALDTVITGSIVTTRRGRK